jgi:hypothetical protein
MRACITNHDSNPAATAMNPGTKIQNKASIALRVTAGRQVLLAGVYWEHRSSALTDFPKLFPANQMARSKAIRFCITLYKTFL